MFVFKKEWGYFLCGLTLSAGIFSFNFASAGDIFDDFFAITRDAGMIFGHKKFGDTDMRWRLNAGPKASVMQFGNGQERPFANMEAIEVDDARVLFELAGPKGSPIGVTFNDRESGSISLVVEAGKLVIRNEIRGRDHVMAILDEQGISFPRAVDPMDPMQ